MTFRDRECHVVLLGLLAALVISCAIISQGKLYWWDELFSYYFAADPYFRHMLVTFGDKINNTPIVYFAIGWVWAQLFGASEISLRLFSSLSMFGAAVVIWVLLRRHDGAWAATFATVCVFTLSLIVLRQNAEARMYGLFLAFGALAFLLHDSIQSRGPCSVPLALAVAMVHALLLHTHLFGIFYSALLISLSVAGDACLRKLQHRLYFAFGAAWLSLLAYLPAFIVQSDVGRPRTWIPPPSLGDLVYFYLVQFSVAWLPMAMLAAIVLWLRWPAPAAPAASEPFPCRWLTSRPTLVLGWCLLLLPLGIWLISLAIKPIFVARYMIPSLVGLAIVLSHLLAALDRSIAAPAGAGGTRGRLVEHLAGLYRASVPRRLALLILLAVPPAYALALAPRGSDFIGIDDFGHPELPFVLQQGNQFLQHLHYDPQSDRYFHLLDWDSAVAAESGNFPPQEFKHMDALLRVYPERFAGRIVPSEMFLAANERFLVVDYANYDHACVDVLPWHDLERNVNRWKESLQCPRWLEHRILADDRYSVTLAGKDARWDSVVLLVERRAD